ncbi:hypothetical protein CspHIS471_0602430 [Cutaneotrichosporon sp. HIS471]|nr:hypothetical protein CspHIS471_0602430 [Cutaneotrichosporon sp. HIS471]
MPRAKARKFYAVRVGRIPGLYHDWESAQKQINGFPGALHRAFKSETEANAYLNASARPQSTVVDLSVESDTESVIDLTSPGKARNSPYARVANESPPSRMTQLAHEYREYIDPPVASSPETFPMLEEQPNLDPPLSEQQQDILKRCMAGDNIFFTGSAGTGKSVLLRALIRSLKARGSGDVAVTASTGMAALNIGGCTLHSWAGIGLGAGEVDRLLRFMNSFARKRWYRTATLLVDEVSMLHGELLDKLDKIGRHYRDPWKPFGGIQIIFCGDFLQLPPVSKEGPVSYAFDSNVWEKLFPRTNMITLNSVFRQSDSRFVDCLESMRRGVVSEAHDGLLRSLNRPLEDSDGIRAVLLYSRRMDVDRENMKNLDAIKSKLERYEAVDRAHETQGGRKRPQHEATDLLNDRSRWPQSLPLKIDAQVMLVTNWKPGLVNGSTGIVTAFLTPDEARKANVIVPSEFEDIHRDRQWPVVRFKPHRRSEPWPDILVPQMTVTVENANQEVEASREQVPLILAWAITIHKSQGLTLDKVCVDLGGAFDCGQAYVAVSRATSLDGLEVRQYTRSKIMTSQRVLDWTQEMADDEKWDELVMSSQVVLDY